MKGETVLANRMATAAEHPYEDTLDGLAIAIRRLRSDCPPRETARRILTYDCPGHTHLVGIDDAGQRVVFYHCEDRYAIAVAIDVGGLSDGGPCVARFERRDMGVKRWVGKLRSYWGWVHPRYR